MNEINNLHSYYELPEDAIGCIVNMLPKRASHYPEVKGRYYVVIQCLMINKHWNKSIMNSNVYQDMEVLYKWPEMGNLPEKVINVFGSITKTYQIPSIKLDCQRVFFSQDFTQKDTREIFVQGINSNCYYCQLLSEDQMKIPMICYNDKFLRTCYAFKVKFSDASNNSEVIIVQLFRKLIFASRNEADKMNLVEDYINHWQVHCYTFEQLYHVESQKLLFAHGPFKVLQTLVSNGIFCDSIAMLELVQDQPKDLL